jgi:hypothetical protein
VRNVTWTGCQGPPNFASYAGTRAKAKLNFNPNNSVGLLSSLNNSQINMDDHKKVSTKPSAIIATAHWADIALNLFFRFTY